MKALALVDQVEHHANALPFGVEVVLQPQDTAHAGEFGAAEVQRRRRRRSRSGAG
ncbi:MAG: hypothetical protein IAE86_01105 [Burkholderiaceae bacterium]|nr:hypothetical protein [Burkholderiaceae bacterium]